VGLLLARFDPATAPDGRTAIEQALGA